MLPLAIFSLLVLTGPFGATVSVTATSAPQSLQSLDRSIATCPFRTVNYITHSLPQQCLASCVRSPCPSPAANSTDQASVSETKAEGSEATHNGQVDHVSLTNKFSSSEDAPSTTPAGVPESPTSTTSLPLSETGEPDEPSPLEGDTFMSFDEWKRQNLRKAGQSEHMERDRNSMPQQREHPVSMNNELDSLGDDSEIDLVFSGFIPHAPGLSHASAASETGRQSDGAATGSAPGIASRSKDAGTTCKARFNYASFDCAATVRQTNPEASNLNAILGENKDAYMLNVCSASNKFIILELCEDISIDTIVLANFEFFSSIFRTFRVSVSDKYPVKADKWKEIGLFEARNSRDIQAFLVENPTIWARYLKIDFLTHYGNEYYCPVSLVRVHGTTMLEEYKRDAEPSFSGDDEESETEAPTVATEETAPVSAEPNAPAPDEKQENPSLTAEQDDTSSSSQAVPTSDDLVSSEADHASLPDATPSTEDDGSYMCANIPLDTNILFLLPSAETHASYTGPPVSSDTLSTANQFELKTKQSVTAAATHSRPGEEHAGSRSRSDTDSTQHSSIETNQTSSEADHVSKSSINGSPKPIANTTASERQKASHSSQAPAATPTMQESFFKSVHKRLQMLEANSSLSLQYIEDQSRALRHAFAKVEERQLAKTTAFLDYLNTTVLNELRDFRTQYDQLWQSTVIELEVQRERYQQENAAINARLGVLADELIFQKRILILQMSLIVICLALVLFARGSLHQYLEMPVVQRVLARSLSNRRSPNLESPTQSNPPTEPSSLRKGLGILKRHRRMQSDDSAEGSFSPNDVYPTPPTPSSMGYDDHPEPEGATEGDKLPAEEDLDFDPSAIERPSTSPPILPSEMPSLPDLIGLHDGETIDSRLAGTGLSTPIATTTVGIDGDPSSVPGSVVDPVLSSDRNAKHLTWNLPER